MWVYDSRLGAVLPGVQEPESADQWLQEAVEEVRETEMSFAERIRMRLNGYIYLGHRMRPGWKGPVPFYGFRCPVHGLVESYPHGYDRRLECPFCAALNKTVKY